MRKIVNTWNKILQPSLSVSGSLANHRVAQHQGIRGFKAEEDMIYN